MKKFAIIAVAALSLSTFGAAIAQDSSTNETGDFDHVDGNKDNVVSMTEAMGVYPTLTQTLFDQADANGDGTLDEGEFSALQGLSAGLEDDHNTTSSSSDSSSSAM